MHHRCEAPPSQQTASPKTVARGRTGFANNSTQGSESALVSAVADGGDLSGEADGVSVELQGQMGAVLDSSTSSSKSSRIPRSKFSSSSCTRSSRAPFPAVLVEASFLVRQLTLCTRWIRLPFGSLNWKSTPSWSRLRGTRGCFEAASLFQ